MSEVLARFYAELEEAARLRASDLHLTAGFPPRIRVEGELSTLAVAPWPVDDLAALAEVLAGPSGWPQLVAAGELDRAIGVRDLSRVRLHLYRQRGSYSVAARILPIVVPELDTLGLPEVVGTWTERATGLVLVTGPTGSGKSTTLAAMVERINERAAKRIITLEDPIEYLHAHRRSMVDQREVGIDTLSFAAGLRAALRADPDVILVGEMRDLDTARTALTAAETGHLVLATLHTTDAAQTLDRLIDLFPPTQQDQARLQLSGVLVGILAQRLVKAAGSPHRRVIAEVLVNTPAVANLIRTGKTPQIRSALQTGRHVGMQTHEQALREAADRGQISSDEAQGWLREWGGGIEGAAGLDVASATAPVEAGGRIGLRGRTPTRR